MIKAQPRRETVVFFLIGAGVEPALHEPAERFHRARCCNTFGTATNTHTHINAGVVAGCVDATGHIAIENQARSRPRRANV